MKGLFASLLLLWGVASANANWWSSMTNGVNSCQQGMKDVQTLLIERYTQTVNFVKSQTSPSSALNGFSWDDTTISVGSAEETAVDSNTRTCRAILTVSNAGYNQRQIFAFVMFKQGSEQLFELQQAETLDFAMAFANSVLMRKALEAPMRRPQ